MDNCKAISTPISKGQHLDKSMFLKSDIIGLKMRIIPYAWAIGSLTFAMISIRPDICDAIGLVSWFQFDPGEEHWRAVKRIRRYL